MVSLDLGRSIPDDGWDTFNPVYVESHCLVFLLFMSQNHFKEMRRSEFTIKNIAINFVVIGLLFSVNKLGELGNLVSFGVLAVFALSSSSGALKALSMLGLIIMGNPYIVEKTMVITYMRFPLIGLAGARIIYDVITRRSELLRLPFLNGLLLFGGVCILIAPINGYFTGVAVLKALVFTYGSYSILSGTMLSRSGFSDLTVWFVAMLAFVSIMSYLTIPLGISHVFRGELLGFSSGVAGLSGVTSHQQVLGSFAAISALLCFVLGVFSKLPHRLLLNLLFLSFIPILWMTKSRTAVATLILSLMFVVALSPFVIRGQKAKFNRIHLGKWCSVFAFAIIVGFMADYATGGSVNNKLMDFAFKGRLGSHYTVGSEEILSSRMGKMEASWYNFKQQPLTGINFGTSTDPHFIANATLLSAPAEKGFLPTAILEETGLVGTCFFVVFLFLIFRQFYIDENIIGVAMLAGFLIQNLGEMMFFSFGGAGLYCWSMVGAGIAIGYRHQSVHRM